MSLCILTQKELKVAPFEIIQNSIGICTIVDYDVEEVIIGFDVKIKGMRKILCL